MKEPQFRSCRILRALGAPIRYQIIRLLMQGRKRPGDIAREIKRKPSAISRHLAVLRAADLVRYDWQEGGVYYWIKCQDLCACLNLAEKLAEKLKALPEE